MSRMFPFNATFIAVIGVVAVPALTARYFPALAHSHPTFSQYGVPAIGLLAGTLLCLAVHRAVDRALGVPA